MAGVGPNGDIISWSPNEEVDVDDKDAAAVAFYEAKASDGVAEILEPAAVKAKKGSSTAKAQED